MLRIGCQLSSSKGYLAAAKQAVSIGANTFQFFTRNPRGGAVKALNMDDINAYLEYAAKHDIAQIMGHAPYTVNPCTAKEELREFAVRVLSEDVGRLDLIPGSLFVFHPGSHVGQGVDTGIAYITEALQTVLDRTHHTPILLETMTGKGSQIGGSFAHLRDIISDVGAHERIGVCLDTCHIHDAGYDILSTESLETILEEFDHTVGLSRLRAIHLNDSMNPAGTRKDRHEKIGKGGIGLDALVRVVSHPKLSHLPFYLETPNALDGYAEEIALLRRLTQSVQAPDSNTT